MSSGLYSGVSGLALGTGLYKGVSGLWGGASGLIAGFGGGFTPASLFTAGESGYWLDPSDFTTMWQDHQGVTPVTATGQTCGLILDKRIGTRTQVFDDANVTFGGPTGYASRVSPGVYEYARDASGIGALVFGGLTAGKTYLISVQVSAYAGAIPGITGVNASWSNTAFALIRPAVSSAGTYTAFYVADGTVFRMNSVALGSGGTISNVSILEVPGNHFLQATAAKRPLLQQDAQGFYYLQGDGTDDVLGAVAAIPANASTSAQQIFGLRTAATLTSAIPFTTRVSLAGGASTPSAAPGSMGLRLINFAATPSMVMNGVNRVTQNLTSVTADTKYVYSLLGNISAPSMVARRNAAPDASNTTSLGGGTFTDSIAYILADNPAGSFFPGRFYQAVMRFGPDLTADQITQTETFVNSKTGAY